MGRHGRREEATLLSLLLLLFCPQEEQDWQWRQAMDYLSAVTELNYMTQIVIMLYEDNEKVLKDQEPPPPPGSSSLTCSCSFQDPASEERFHVELHFSPGVKGCEDEDNVPLGFGFRPASSEVPDPPTYTRVLRDDLCLSSVYTFI